MSFTPGPWNVIDGSVVDATNTVIACSGVSLVHGFVPEDDESRFNDRLISAAPELLWALQQIIQDLPSRRDWLDPDVENVARAAIRKAKGEA